RREVMGPREARPYDGLPGTGRSCRAAWIPDFAVDPSGLRITAMKSDEDLDPDRQGGNGGLLLLILLACIVGAGAGAIGALFRLSLLHADAWRDRVIGWSHMTPIVGCLLVTSACAAVVALAAWLVRRFSPEASGSGIPHVEAV